MGSVLSNSEISYRVLDKKGTITISKEIIQGYQPEPPDDEASINESFNTF